MDISNAKKISVVGNSGSGKSTLSKKLGEALDIEVFTLDKVFWQAGWKLRDQKEYKELHDAWVNSDSWIIDGVGYWDEMQQRLLQSEVVIFLDIPDDICVESAKKRIEAEQYSPNQDIAEGCIYGNVQEQQMEMIKYFHETLRPKLISFLSELGNEKVITLYNYEGLNFGSKT